jgi:hypothetical protein
MKAMSLAEDYSERKAALEREYRDMAVIEVHCVSCLH